MNKIDALLQARWIIPVAPSRTVYEDHCLAIHQGKILDLLPALEARARYDPAEWLTRNQHAVIPGLINCHTHTAMSLMRGLADDLPLMDWLNNHIWPAESRWVGPDFVQAGAALAVAEMLESGTTCFGDMYFFPDLVARTAADLGMRARVGIPVVEFASAWAGSAGEYINKGLEVHDEFKGHPLVSMMFAPHSPYAVSEQSLARVRKFSDQLEVPVQMHVHETRAEIQEALAQHGKRPLERLDEMGLLSPLMMGVHMTQLEEHEIEQAAETGIHVVHCPESNLKLASGFCPVANLKAAGVNVALGTDGPASNNDLDMLGEMRTAALLAKGVSGDARAVDAEAALRMATLDGARALGLEHETGSLERGKWADIACIDFSPLSTQPVYDPISQIVYSASRGQVTDVWVAGRRLLSDGQLTRVDTKALSLKVGAWQRRIGGHSTE